MSQKLSLRFIASTLLMITWLGACANTPSNTLTDIKTTAQLINKPNYSGVIMEKGKYPQVYEFQGLYIKLEETDIEKAEKILLECIQNETKDARAGSVLENLQTYKRQYFAHLDDTNRTIVHIHGLSPNLVTQNPNWQNQTVMELYGGKDYFQARINLTDEKCEEFHINPEKK